MLLFAVKKSFDYLYFDYLNACILHNAVYTTCIAGNEIYSGLTASQTYEYTVKSVYTNNEVTSGKNTKESGPVQMSCTTDTSRKYYFLWTLLSSLPLLLFLLLSVFWIYSCLPLPKSSIRRKGWLFANFSATTLSSC